ncbi:MupG family TIM beta-alpha barrel fold protein, partial [Liquorilactobacillus ghanensis]
MKNLGISIYPENSTLEEDINYLKLAHENGFSRVFTSLLQVNN